MLSESLFDRVRPRFGKPAVADLTLASVGEFRDLDELESAYAESANAFIYARDGHPNARRLALLLAEREGAEAAAVFPSGMAAISAACLELLRSGDRVAISRQLYGKTISLFQNRMQRFGVTVDFFDPTDRSELWTALELKPRLVWVESLSNPFLRIARIDEISAQTRSAGAILAVDSTFTPPPMLRPLGLGADLAMHSLTKMVSGHSDATLGGIAGNAALVQRLRAAASELGHHASAFDCWLTERGLATLDLRLTRSSENALAIAQLLQDRPEIKAVHYPGLDSHPDHDWLKRRGSNFGNMLSFEIHGGRSAVNRLFRRFRFIRFCPSLGDVGTTVSHPASTSHRAITDELRQSLGLGDGLVRVSVGVEPIDRLIDDFEKGISET